MLQCFHLVLQFGVQKLQTHRALYGRIFQVSYLVKTALKDKARFFANSILPAYMKILPQ